MNHCQCTDPDPMSYTPTGARFCGDCRLNLDPADWGPFDNQPQGANPLPL